ncbi:MAG: hypothetical protein QM741_14665 [Rudaea sp.]|uniref:hypothetical protein n=1 Tax=Rudaea sp. TaxID=2136325 RepID=UPI0039E3210B
MSSRSTQFRDPPAAAPSSATRDLPIHSGVTPPRFDFDVVVTPTLKMLLRLESLPKLLSISAPPGYGKSIVLSQLHVHLQKQGIRCIWATLDDRDNDLSSVVYRLRAAVEKLDEAGDLPPEPASPFADRVAASDSVIAQIDSLRGPTAVFIDNLQFCADADLAGFLDRLVFSTDASVKVLLSSTKDIPVDLARAKLELGALDLQAADLCFDKESTALLLRQAGIESAADEDSGKDSRADRGLACRASPSAGASRARTGQVGGHDAPEHGKGAAQVRRRPGRHLAGADAARAGGVPSLAPAIHARDRAGARIQHRTGDLRDRQRTEP